MNDRRRQRAHRPAQGGAGAAEVEDVLDVVVIAELREDLVQNEAQVALAEPDRLRDVPEVEAPVGQDVPGEVVVAVSARPGTELAADRG